MSSRSRLGCPRRGARPGRGPGSGAAVRIAGRPGGLRRPRLPRRLPSGGPRSLRPCQQGARRIARRDPGGRLPRPPDRSGTCHRERPGSPPRRPALHRAEQARLADPASPARKRRPPCPRLAAAQAAIGELEQIVTPDEDGADERGGTDHRPLSLCPASGCSSVEQPMRACCPFDAGPGQRPVGDGRDGGWGRRTQDRALWLTPVGMVARTLWLCPVQVICDGCGGRSDVQRMEAPAMHVRSTLSARAVTALAALSLVFAGCSSGGGSSDPTPDPASSAAVAPTAEPGGGDSARCGPGCDVRIDAGSSGPGGDTGPAAAPGEGRLEVNGRPTRSRSARASSRPTARPRARSRSGGRKPAAHRSR